MLWKDAFRGAGRCKRVPIKVNGQQETVQIEQAGPIAYVESTTLTKVFNEDANRCILVNTDEQPEQTGGPFSRGWPAATPAAAECDVQHIQDRHHAIQAAC